MGTAPTPALGHRFRALRHRNFRLFWSGQIVSLVGTWMQSVAEGWLMHRLTDSPFMLGLLGFAQFAPATLLSLWAGVIADRFDKRRLLLITQSCAFAQAIAIAVLSSTGHIRPWMLLVLAFVLGTINAFDLPTRQSAIVEMVDDRDDLPNAIALNSAEFNVARILGPAVAGVALATMGETGCFWANALSYLAVLSSLMQMRLPRREGVRARATLGSLREGVAYAMRTTSIRNLLVLLSICGGLGYQYTILLPVYTRTILHANAGAFGALTSSFGVGSLIAALSMTRVLDRWTLRRNLLIGLLSAGVGLGAFAWSRWLPLTLAMGLVAGFGLILYVASTNTLVQMTTQDAYRGRVMSLYTFMFIGTTPLGALLAGTVAERAGAPFATSLCALFLLAGALWVSARLRVLRGQEAAAAAEVPSPEKVG